MPSVEGWLRYAVAVAAGYALAVHMRDPPTCQPATSDQLVAGTYAPDSARSIRAALTALDRPKEFDYFEPRAAAATSTGEGVDLDFIEIGTSNFETLIEKAPDGARGLSVEGLKMYQDKLPDRPGVTKVNAAISDPKPGETTIDFFYIHPEDIRKHNLPAWLVGCNAAGAPQKEAAKILYNRNKTHLMRTDRVPVLSFGQLTDRYNVRSIGYFKLDVEGHEPVILRSMIKACRDRPAMWPRAILFEHKHVKGPDQRALISELGSHGYTVVSHTTAEHQDYVLARIGQGAIRTEGLARDPSLVGDKKK